MLRQSLADEVPTETFLQAAIRDLRDGLTTRTAGGTPLMAVEVAEDSDSGSISVEISGPRQSRTVALPAAVVKRAMRHGLGPVQLVAAALAAGLAAGSALDDGWVPVPDTQPDPFASIRKLEGLYERTSADPQIDQSVAHQNHVLLIGNHGSGKSATVAAHADAYQRQGGTVVWLDLAEASAGPQTVFHRFLCAERQDAYLVVVDGTQANIPVLQEVFAAATELREQYGVPLVMLATGLTTLVRRLPDLFRNFRHVIAQPGEIVDALLTGLRLEPEQQRQIRELADDDLVIARMALAFQRAKGRVPTAPELENEHVGDLGDKELRRALYRFACLGYFQIDVSADAAAALDFPAAVLQTLLNRGLLITNNGQYSAGPRSRAALVLRHALRRWDAEQEWGHPAELAWRHLQVAGEAAIRATLDRLDLIGAGDGQDEGPNSSVRYLRPTWDRVRKLERHLERLCAEDPKWHDNAGAAIFAALAMARMHKEAAWKPLAEFIRGRWSYEDPGELPAPIGDNTADYGDFPKIHAAMAAEDEQKAESGVDVREKAADIDLDRFYRGWMLGMLLCFEGSALHEDWGRVHRLQDIASKVQHPEGFFYPRRVPWVTARVVLGLCASGLSYETSETVRLACDWLLQLVTTEGGTSTDAWWRSGTGSWNRQEATTAMCLAALLHADAPLKSLQRTAMTWLWTEGRKREWNREGREIDLALVIEATSLDRERWRDAYRLVRDLLPWAVRAHDERLPVEDVNEGDLRLPFVTFELMTFVWRLVNREFSVVLGEMLRLSPEPEPLPADDAWDNRSWREAADQIVRKIQHELGLRDRHLRNSTLRNAEIRDAVDQLRRDQAAARGFAARLETGAGPELLREIDRMGLKYLGLAWPELPWPG